LQLEVELMQRRIVVAKAERIDTAQLELEFAEKLAALDALAGQLAPGTPSTPGAKPAAGSGDAQRTKRRRPSGRRDLRMLSIPEERIELTDPALEGKAPRIGTEDSYKVMWRRGGAVRVVFARVKYRVEPDPPTTDVTPTTATIITAELPPQMIARSLATPSLLAHVVSDKLCDGLPLHRQEDRFARLGVTLDRGTMSRWQQDVGLTVGATVVEAMRADALAHAFCLATDATGVLVQPTRNDTGVRQPCRRGHFFVQIADADHVFFEYTPKETSAVVSALFRGFSGYIQADAKSVYDLLFRPPDQRTPPDDGGDVDDAIRHEVGCWSHYLDLSVIRSAPCALVDGSRGSLQITGGAVPRPRTQRRGRSSPRSWAASTNCEAR
jgi:transposase